MVGYWLGREGLIFAVEGLKGLGLRIVGCIQRRREWLIAPRFACRKLG